MDNRDGPNWIVVGDLLVCFFPAGPVGDLVWSTLCELIAGRTIRKVLLASIGAMELVGEQRRELSEALSVEPMASLAVVSDEALVRGTMTAASWRTRVELKLFAWHKLPEVHSYLGPAGVDPRDLNGLVEDVRRRVKAL